MGLGCASFLSSKPCPNFLSFSKFDFLVKLARDGFSCLQPDRILPGIEAFRSEGKFYQRFPRMDIDKKNIRRPCETDTPFRSGRRAGREGMWAQEVSEKSHHFVMWFSDFPSLSASPEFTSIPQFSHVRYGTQPPV